MMESSSAISATVLATSEDQLLLPFQGMIAEYERAQILERSRRGKRHRARQGQVSVLSGAPYGYRYIRKTDQEAAHYEIIEAEADVVRRVYDRYTVSHMSIGAIIRWLNDQVVPTRKGFERWERSSLPHLTSPAPPTQSDRHPAPPAASTLPPAAMPDSFTGS